jgi:hypothetical protein
VTQLNGDNGFILEKELDDSHRFGQTVGRAGDVNGDGIDDIAIGDTWRRYGAMV